ncbi:transporter substrate-binding domain-containing protein [Clostridium tarantellae]|uniref:Transporter substrate-binding domain-containing protein n=1 Tax=Clostridium tarantellae TaxID=39493 RepID=A0A6I1MKC5_9CLOT|nr:transporter substrate-binding domain-containing protein [Clostridium tarantellae]MPQ42597.1 transporter substrate-binding domain-containing protein [Clostridium tarantellae]
MKKGIFKKIFTTLAISMMSLSLLACGGNKPKTVSEKEIFSEDIKAIKDKGSLVVGLSADYAPYEFHKIINGKDEIVGFDIEIAKEIAKDLGVKLEIKDMKFSTLIGALPTGKIDMIVSGMSSTPERAEVVDFSNIYYKADQGIVIKEKDKEKYQTLEDFTSKKVGAQMGTIQAELIKKEIKDVDLKLLSHVKNLVTELKVGKIDGIAVELPVAEMILKGNKEFIIATPQLKDENNGSAIAVKKGSEGLLKQVNETIKKLQDSGKINEFIIQAQELAYE